MMNVFHSIQCFSVASKKKWEMFWLGMYSDMRHPKGAIDAATRIVGSYNSDRNDGEIKMSDPVLHELSPGVYTITFKDPSTDTEIIFRSPYYERGTRIPPKYQTILVSMPESVYYNSEQFILSARMHRVIDPLEAIKHIATITTASTSPLRGDCYSG